MIVSCGVARIPRVARMFVSASRSGRYPRVWPYCSTLASAPVRIVCAISRRSSQAKRRGSGNPGASEIRSATTASRSPALRIADWRMARAAAEKYVSIGRSDPELAEGARPDVGTGVRQRGLPWLFRAPPIQGQVRAERRQADVLEDQS